jgi:hypothetical protein
MFKAYYGICTECKKERLLVVKKLLCKQCNYEAKEKRTVPTIIGRNTKNRTIKFSARKLWPSRKGNKKIKSPPEKKRKPIQYSKKRTGEMEVYKKIWKERGPYSQISGRHLGEYINPCFFSHIVPKSIAPSLRLDPRNIILKTPEEHILYENHKHKIRNLPEWQWVFELEEKLKQECHNPNNQS